MAYSLGWAVSLSPALVGDSWSDSTSSLLDSEVVVRLQHHDVAGDFADTEITDEAEQSARTSH